MAKISGFFVFLFGFGTKKAAQMRERKITPKRTKKSLNKSSGTTRRDSKAVVDLSAASNNSLDQQTNQDEHTEILDLKDLTHSSDWYEGDVVPYQAVYQAPFDSGDKDENLILAVLKTKLVSQVQELRNELLDEVRDKMKSNNDEIRDEMKIQMDEIRDEMKAQIKNAVEQLTEIIQRAEKV